VIYENEAESDVEVTYVKVEKEQESDGYTGALTVALPAETDPATDLVDDSPHITLNWLGDSGDLGPELTQAIMQCVGTAAMVTPPFSVKVAGTATLGDDGANVLLVESAELVALRELLMTAPPVAAAMASCEQYPNFVPHLTLNYGGGLPPEEEVPDSIEIAAIGLWLGEKRMTFDLAGAQDFEALWHASDDAEYIADDTEADGFFDPLPMSAAAGVWDPALHPRGKDGKFIRKNSVIKFLSKVNGMWNYGKVTGIYPGPGGPVINVTPSNLSGVPTGAPDIELKPSDIYTSPEKKANLSTSSPNAKQVGPQLGSNPGASYEITEPGTVVKGEISTAAPETTSSAPKHYDPPPVDPDKAEALAKVPPAYSKQPIDNFLVYDDKVFVQQGYSGEWMRIDPDTGDTFHDNVQPDPDSPALKPLYKRSDIEAEYGPGEYVGMDPNAGKGRLKGLPIEYDGWKYVTFGPPQVIRLGWGNKARFYSYNANQNKYFRIVPSGSQAGNLLGDGYTPKQIADMAANENMTVTEWYPATGKTESATKKWRDIAKAPDASVILPAVIEQAAEPKTTKYYVKTPKTKKHGQNEELANDLYAAAGVRVPNVSTGLDGKTYSEMEPAVQDMQTRMSDPVWREKLQKDFVVDAWLANWDVFGANYDNVMTTSDGSETPLRIDAGGSLLFRAQGSPKGADFGDAVGELESLRQGKNAAVYGKDVMSKDAELDGAQRVLAISPGAIDDMVAERGLPKSLADTLKARRSYIASYYGLPLPESIKPMDSPEPTTAPLVDPADITSGGGKDRKWSHSLSMPEAYTVLEPGDRVQFTSPNGDVIEEVYGVAESGEILNTFNSSAQLYSWLTSHANDKVRVRKGALFDTRIDHDAEIPIGHLTDYRYERGDRLVDPTGTAYFVLGTNKSTGAVLLRRQVSEGVDKPSPFLVDGANAGPYTMKRWNPPVVPESVQSPVNAPNDTQVANTPDTPVELEEWEQELLNAANEPAVPTGMAVTASDAIKADLVTPLPDGSGNPPGLAKPKTPPAKKSTSVVEAAQTMVLGDGNTATPGVKVVSKVDGQEYEFLNKAGPYAAVKGADGKEYLKTVGTLSVAGAAPNPEGIQKPKSSNGVVPAVGMTATAKDGHTGQIVMVSPDGQFIWITNSAGVKKRKSTTAVKIDDEGGQTLPEAAPQPAVIAPLDADTTKTIADWSPKVGDKLTDPANGQVWTVESVGYGSNHYSISLDGGTAFTAVYKDSNKQWSYQPGLPEAPEPPAVTPEPDQDLPDVDLNDQSTLSGPPGNVHPITPDLIKSLSKGDSFTLTSDNGESVDGTVYTLLGPPTTDDNPVIPVIDTNGNDYTIDFKDYPAINGMVVTKAGAAEPVPNVDQADVNALYTANNSTTGSGVHSTGAPTKKSGAYIADQITLQKLGDDATFKSMVNAGPNLVDVWFNDDDDNFYAWGPSTSVAVWNPVTKLWDNSTDQQKTLPNMQKVTPELVGEDVLAVLTMPDVQGPSVTTVSDVPPFEVPTKYDPAGKKLVHVDFGYGEPRLYELQDDGTYQRVLFNGTLAELSAMDQDIKNGVMPDTYTVQHWDGTTGESGTGIFVVAGDKKTVSPDWVPNTNTGEPGASLYMKLADPDDPDAPAMVFVAHADGLWHEHSFNPVTGKWTWTANGFTADYLTDPDNGPYADWQTEFWNGTPEGMGQAGIVADGYQTEANDKVVAIVTLDGSVKSYVQPGGTGNYFKVENGALDVSDPISETLVDWMKSEKPEGDFTILQGGADTPAGTPTPDILPGASGVIPIKSSEVIIPSGSGLGSLWSAVNEKIDAVGKLEQGQSLWTNSGGTQLYILKADGNYHWVYPDGDWAVEPDTDPKSDPGNYWKLEFGAPSAVPSTNQASAPTPPFTLPSGYNPTGKKLIHAISTDNSVDVEMEVWDDGTFHVISSLDGTVYDTPVSPDAMDLLNGKDNVTWTLWANGVSVSGASLGDMLNAPSSPINPNGLGIVPSTTTTSAPAPTAPSFDIPDAYDPTGKKVLHYSNVNPTTGASTKMNFEVAADGSLHMISPISGEVDQFETDPIYLETSSETQWTLWNNGIETTTEDLPPLTTVSVFTTPVAPTPAPAAPATPAPNVPLVMPDKPGGEAINSWKATGGVLTKNGYIPKPGMTVTNASKSYKGKIISVSKDGKTATLDIDGKKSKRIIDRLVVTPGPDPTKPAYVAPPATLPVPSGMPFAADPPGEALTKTIKDGQWRPIVSGSGGTVGGEMVVTSVKTPSGKKVNRVLMNLTHAQVDKLRDKLSQAASTPPKLGDWAKSSKDSGDVAVGDIVSMRWSSHSSAWKVSTDGPATHKVSKVEPKGDGNITVTLENMDDNSIITSNFMAGHTGGLPVFTWDPNKPKIEPDATSTSSGVATYGNRKPLVLSDEAKAAGWAKLAKHDGVISKITGGVQDGVLDHEPGTPVGSSVIPWHDGVQPGLRKVTADGVVVEVMGIDFEKSSGGWGGGEKGIDSAIGLTAITLPEGTDETHLNAALADLGIPITPLTQDSAKTTAKGMLRNLLSLDMTDSDSTKGWTDKKLFDTAGTTLGIPDLTWDDILVGTDESTGKVSYFWSERVQKKIASKIQVKQVIRASGHNSGTPPSVMSALGFGAANGLLKRAGGMTGGHGSSPHADSLNNAGNGSFSSAINSVKLPGRNPLFPAGEAMVVYYHPMSVLSRIQDWRAGPEHVDAWGKGHGQGSSSLKAALNQSQVQDLYLGGGIPGEATGYISLPSQSGVDAAIQYLKSKGVTSFNGRALEDVILTHTKAKATNASTMTAYIPPNVVPITSIPLSYDTVTAAAEAEEVLVA